MKKPEDFNLNSAFQNAVLRLEDAQHLLKSAKLEDLDEYTLNHYGGALAIVRGITELFNGSAVEIYKNLGADIFWWVFYHDPEIREIEFLPDMSAKLLVQARSLAIRQQRLPGGGEAKMAKQIYYLIEKINEYTSSINLPELLQCNRNTDNPLSDKRLKDYSLAPIALQFHKYAHCGRPNDWEGKVINGKEYSIYMDAFLGILLNYKKIEGVEIPNAIVSFLPSDTNTLMTYQLQGVRPRRIDNDTLASSRGLAPIYWRKALIEIVKQVARKSGFSRIGIQGARNNKWVDDGHLDMDSALKNYDYVAETLGFRKNEDGNWYKKISR